MKNKKQANQNNSVNDDNSDTTEKPQSEIMEMKNATTEVPTKVNLKFKFKNINGIPTATYE